MSNIALNYSGQTGDLDLTGHRLNLITGEAAIEQNLRIRLRFFLGEHFLDLRQGMPFFSEILIKNPNMLLVRSIFRQAILDTAGISAVTSLTASINSSTRTLSLNFAATMDTGAELVFAPFIIEI
jgi:hypothetical protein